VGDAVFGIAPGCLGSAVIVLADLMVALPPHISFEAAASVPTVYCTVHAALGADLTTLSDRKVWIVCTRRGEFVVLLVTGCGSQAAHQVQG
jgi:NADPH:quinone reductase-like Zn-dependent oxidoreductase